MSLVKNRPLLLPAVASIVLWIVGLVVTNKLSDTIPHHPTDAQLLTWMQHNDATIITGGWLWMTGCLVFLVLAAVLRTRLADAEGGHHTVSNLAFAGAAAATVFGMLIPSGDVGGAIDQESINAGTAATLHHIGDAFFVAAELALILFFAGTAYVALRTGVLPRAWAYFSILIAIVLFVGPIGWAALIFGTPVWLIGTGLIVGSRERVQRRTVATAAA